MTDVVAEKTATADLLDLTVMYGSLVLMALGSILIGAFRSVESHREQAEKARKTGKAPKVMTTRDAAIFPLRMSYVLYLFYYFRSSKESFSINLPLSIFFSGLGTLTLTQVISPLLLRIIPSAVPRIPFHIMFTKGCGDNKKELVNFKFTTHHIIIYVLSTIVGVWYLLNKHWIANNILAIAFAIDGFERLHLNKVLTGCIFLGGLFFYDIFWVFGTDVMVTVAKNIEAPIKLVFPQDLLENGSAANNFAMLGLGDIVLPGIFIALLLRYDNSLKRGSKFYFWTAFIAYIFGLLTTIVIMQAYNHAQPALLYLVPACVGCPILMALVRGDIKSMFNYADYPEKEEKSPSKAKE